MSYTNPATEIYGKVNEYIKNESVKDVKKTNSSKKGLLRSNRSMSDTKISDTPLARVLEYVKTIRQERDKLNGSE
tara:strand:+ start:481 stop:705 length:225 start_codon:yes stop_codon:yes gene_type:complete